MNVKIGSRFEAMSMPFGPREVLALFLLESFIVSRPVLNASLTPSYELFRHVMWDQHGMVIEVLFA